MKFNWQCFVFKFNLNSVVFKRKADCYAGIYMLLCVIPVALRYFQSHYMKFVPFLVLFNQGMLHLGLGSLYRLIIVKPLEN